ncbi:unnamed protein product [Microthlaspi erraticum]|uniref:Uncharacterized protein n=1 Tax=Microthlaspi erraticum TaxID=1685480 RepID=A0A6D2HVN6_9BRAS|nr:unnamed protein product [Microthlaspi erraticum]
MNIAPVGTAEISSWGLTKPAGFWWTYLKKKSMITDIFVTLRCLSKRVISRNHSSHRNFSPCYRLCCDNLDILYARS